MPELVTRHRSHGPHLQFTDSILFITWRLAFTLPQHVMQLFNEIRSNKEYQELQLKELKQSNSYIFAKFWEYDEALGKLPQLGFSLNDTQIAEILRNTMHYYNGKTYDLYAFCIMSNHVHLVVRALKKEDEPNYEVDQIVQSIKKYSSKQINEFRGRTGQIWDNFYFDRIIRDEENFYDVMNYVLNNPVKAGLVDSAGKWRDSYQCVGLV